MIYAIGIDPGQTGGIAVGSADQQTAEAHRFPEDISNAMQLLRDLRGRSDIRLAAIEKVGAMPKQGVSSTFKFGANFGAWLGGLAALDIPHVLITPAQWQRRMLDSGTGQTKERSLNMARRLFPQVDLRFKRDDGKADALHLARFALTQIPR